jgi:hypothetical protein
MQLAALIHSLEVGADAIPALVAGLSDDEARRPPAPGKWPVVSILSHLADEERDDFRRRLRATLEGPAAPWPPIDPEGWARERNYAARSLPPVLEGFRRERAASLAWLHSLSNADWQRAHEHPKLGPLRAGDLLAAWAAHDFLHLRQLANTRLALVQFAAEPFTTRYATA